jgi:hypothetical protein
MSDPRPTVEGWTEYDPYGALKTRARLRGGPHDGKTIEILAPTRTLRYAGDEVDGGEYFRIALEPEGDIVLYKWRLKGDQ